MCPSARKQPPASLPLSGAQGAAQPDAGSRRPLSALLSQLLVAFTVELDNDFELRMARLGFPGDRLSLAAWLGLLRFVGENPTPVCDLAAQTLMEQTHIKSLLGCLERWRFVWIGCASAGKEASAGPDTHIRSALHQDWGSGRGMNARTTAQLTPMGAKARESWEPLPREIEGRWRKRFGAEEIGGLRHALESILDQVKLELPQGFFDIWGRRGGFPPRTRAAAANLPLAALLSQLLIVFAIEFEPKSDAPLALCANTRRVLSEEPTAESELPRLTGCSPETCGIGWQLKPFVVVEPDPRAKRGKALRLSARGQLAKKQYIRLNKDIEQGWEKQFGKERVDKLRSALLKIFDLEGNGPHPLLISEGLVPPPGVLRAGNSAPALGRMKTGPAALQRMRDLVAQTEAFVADPVHALPHYPMLDMNRGFGP